MDEQSGALLSPLEVEIIDDTNRLWEKICQLLGDDNADIRPIQEIRNVVLRRAALRIFPEVAQLLHERDEKGLKTD